MKKEESILEQVRQLGESLLSDTVGLLPKLLVSLLVLLIGWLIARICQRLTAKLILLLDDQINTRLRQSFLSVDLKRSAQFVGRTIFWIIILFALAIVTQTLGIPVLTSWFDRLVQFIPNLLAALVIVLAGVVASRLVGDLIGSAISQTEVTGGQSIKKLVRFVILFIASVVAINQIGIDINFLTNLVVVIIATLLFGAALAFGLGAKTSISNILGAYYFQKSYHVGNLVKVGDVEGEIVKITTTAVYLKTKNGQVTIPAKVFNEEKSTLLNESNHAD